MAGVEFVPERQSFHSSFQLYASLHAKAALYNVSSSQNRPTSCMPTGRRKSAGPSGGESIPHGIDRAGWPVLLNGSVFQVCSRDVSLTSMRGYVMQLTRPL